LATSFGATSAASSARFSAAALLLGAAWLAWKHIIGWRIPVSYIGHRVRAHLDLRRRGRPVLGQHSLPVYHVFAGGLILARSSWPPTWSPRPSRRRAASGSAWAAACSRWSFALVGGYPEGVSYSILLMNIFVPLIDRWDHAQPFGEVKK
jgi:electron transport complex protein RnfD